MLQSIGNHKAASSIFKPVEMVSCIFFSSNITFEVNLGDWNLLSIFEANQVGKRIHMNVSAHILYALVEESSIEDK